MAVGDLLKYAHRAIFSKPTPEKRLIKLAKQQPVRRVVEVGVHSLDGAEALLKALVKQARDESVVYTAIDPFDERPSGRDSLRLVEAYRRLAATGAKVRLVPGALASGLASEANALGDTDLLMLSDAATEAATWFYLPRMCHPGTLVLQRDLGEVADEGPDWAVVSLDEVAQRAATPEVRRAA